MQYADKPAVELKEHVFVSDAFKLMRPYSHCEAHWMKGSSQITVNSMFEKTEGFMPLLLDSKGARLEALAEVAKKEIADAEKSLEKVTTCTSVVLATRLKRLRSEALQKARDAHVSPNAKVRFVEWKARPKALADGTAGS